MRIALYARYSSDRQSDRSIEDQVALCRSHAGDLAGGVDIVEIYADYAISGASAINRPNLQRLLEDARAGRFEAVLAEALDRISRDQEDVAAIAKRLKFAGVALLTVSEGEIGSLHIGLKGTMNAIYLEDLADKVRRGLAGRIADGRSAGGLSYGYKVVRKFDAAGEPIRGYREIDDEQAEIIREIFDRYIGGESPKKIAYDLNARAIPGPKGGPWRVSTIIGDAARGNGILANAAYKGELVWNRVRMVKDPETGRRISRLRPRSEWTIREAPELLIVAPDKWQAAQDRRAELRRRPLGGQRHRPKRIFSGLLVCGSCGGAYTIAQTGRYACVARRDRGTCDQGRTITAVDLETRVLSAISANLLEPSRIELFVKEYQAERRRLAKELVAGRRRLEKRLADLTRDADRLVDAICKGLDTERTNERLLELEAERKEIKRRIEAERAEDKVTRLQPNLGEQYRKAVSEIGELVTDGDPAAHEAAAVLRSLIERIVIKAGPERGDVELEVHGSLATLIHGTSAAAPAPAYAAAGGDHRVMVKMVAGEGLEPPTRGL